MRYCKKYFPNEYSEITCHRCYHGVDSVSGNALEEISIQAKIKPFSFERQSLFPVKFFVPYSVVTDTYATPHLVR